MRWKIGNSVFDKTPRRIIRDSQVTPLNCIQGKLLEYLIENYDHPYTDKQLIRAVGEGLLTAETITKYISLLRDALGGERKAYIESVPYRLIVKPQQLLDDELTAKITSFSDDELSGFDRPSDIRSRHRADERRSVVRIGPDIPSLRSESSPGRLDPFASVPALPPNFIHRPEYALPLRDALLTSKNPMAVTAVEGLGGVGKTVVVLELCYDPAVRLAFPDGIIWLVIGKEEQGSLKDRIRRVAMGLNQEFREYSEVAYRTALISKAVLIVLDDVWNIADVEPLLIGSGSSRLLYTTRDTGLAGSLGAHSHAVGVLEPDEARRFLSQWSGRGFGKLPEPSASGILNACNGLALALAMIGAALKSKPDERWKFVLDDLKQAQLRKIATKLVGYRYQDLHASIEVSVNALEPFAKRRYLTLAILLEDMSASGEFLRYLWGDSKRKVDDLICLFVDLSLASRASNGGIRLHDLQLDFIRGEYPDQVALQLMQTALASSLHTVSADGSQFASQMTARLLVHRTIQKIDEFLDGLDISAPRPRIWPLRTLFDSGKTLGSVQTSWTDETIKTETTRLHEPKAIHDDSPRGSGRVKALVFTQDQHHVIAGSEDHTLCFWDIDRLVPPEVLSVLPFGSNFAVALTPDGSRAVFGSRREELYLWDRRLRPQRAGNKGGQPYPIPASGRLRPLKSHSGIVLAVALNANGQVGISASDDKSLVIWDFKHDKPFSYLIQQPNKVTAVALTENGLYAVSGSQNGILNLWEVAKRRSIYTWTAHSSPVQTAALTQDGLRVISGSDDGIVCLMSLRDGDASTHSWSAHFGSINGVALTPSGRFAISVSTDASIRVWDTSTFHCLSIFTCDSPIWSCVCSETHIIAGDADGLLHVFSWQE